MPSIEVIIRDDDGNIMRPTEAQAVKLSGLSLSGVEAAVEAWRREALPSVESTLLEAAQRSFTEAQKANSTCAGTGTDE
jgi:hypothetical protein